MTRVASSWGVQGTTTVDPSFYTRTVESYLKDYLSKDRGAIRNIYTRTDIADFGRNIVTIVHVDSSFYRFPISSRFDALRAYIYIISYVNTHGYIEELDKISIVYGSFSTSQKQQKLDIERKKRLSLERAGNVYYLPYAKDYMDNTLIDLNLLANKLGLSPENAKEALEREANRIGALPTRAKARRRTNVLTAVRQRATYELLLSQSRFADTTLPDHERLLEAKNLVQTYDKLRKNDPNFDSDVGTVQAARSFLNKLNYRRRQSQLSRLDQP